jgi:hypothetical protein
MVIAKMHSVSITKPNPSKKRNNRRIALRNESDLFRFFYTMVSFYFLAVFEDFALAVFFAAGLAELPHGFLAAQPPLGAILLTPFQMESSLV